MLFTILVVIMIPLSFLAIEIPLVFGDSHFERGYHNHRGRREA